MTNEEYMKIAIDEAKKGLGYTTPNPIVGAVIVKNNKIISKDYHHKYGEFHAERNAINKCSENMVGATIYVTLEPCCHYGKTPPCTQAIIESGISKVVIGSVDPNELVAGKGIKILRENGIEVVTDVLKDECDALNEIFFHYIKNKTPFVLMKYAMTADGKIATSTGESKWITGENARENVQKTRHIHTAIMVGVNTVLKDDPRLTVRDETLKQPIRIVCDTNLKTPFESFLVCTANVYPTIIATCSTDDDKILKYETLGCKVIRTKSKNKHVDVLDLMIKLGELKIDSLLLEGGSKLNFSCLEAGIVKKVQAYIAPKIFGGENALSPVSGEGVKFPKDAFMLKKPKVKFIDDDILIEWSV